VPRPTPSPVLTPTAGLRDKSNKSHHNATSTQGYKGSHTEGTTGLCNAPRHASKRSRFHCKSPWSRACSSCIMAQGSDAQRPPAHRRSMRQQGDRYAARVTMHLPRWSPTSPFCPHVPGLVVFRRVLISATCIAVGNGASLIWGHASTQRIIRPILI